MNKLSVMVTGGAGFFGSSLMSLLLKKDEKVICYDLNLPHFSHENLLSIEGNILDKNLLQQSLKDVKIVHHNVAQVPIAKNKKLFWEVNYKGTDVLLDSCLKANVDKVVFVSSSAVFGVPESNPVFESTIPKPQEAYGEAKYEAELLCKEYINKGLNISIIRPRTIIGSGRLGIFQILFEWIYQNKNVPVLGSGSNLYQFIHSDDLASACYSASLVNSPGIYNVGAENFCSMREMLESLIKHSNSSSRVVGIPKRFTSLMMNFFSFLRLSPLGPYHSLMYGESMYFDISKAKKELGFNSEYSNVEMFIQTYDWYVENRNDILDGNISGSKHQSKLKQGILSIVPYFLI